MRILQLQASHNPSITFSSSLQNHFFSHVFILFFLNLNFSENVSFCSFDAIVSADLFVNLKPAPDIFLAAAKSLGLQPHEVLDLPLVKFRLFSGRLPDSNLKLVMLVGFSVW
jgi:hypothetical protein